VYSRVRATKLFKFWIHNIYLISIDKISKLAPDHSVYANLILWKEELSRAWLYYNISLQGTAVITTFGHSIKIRHSEIDLILIIDRTKYLFQSPLVAVLIKVVHSSPHMYTTTMGFYNNFCVIFLLFIRC